MVQRMTVNEAQRRLPELVEGVRRTGEPVIIGEVDAPAAALVNASDLHALKRLRDQERHIGDFRRGSASAMQDDADLQPTEEEEEIVRAVKATREAIYREQYDRA